MRGRLQNQRGFTLVEVMVAVTLFAVGVLGLVKLQAESSRYAVMAQERNRAALLCNELVALMWANQSTTPDADALDTWRARLADEQQSGLHEASASIGAADAQGTVTITLSWQSVARGRGAAAGRYVTQFVVPGGV